jgi:hypothetical protein
MYTSGFLPGFPIESPACPGTVTGEPHDSVALKVHIKVPTNAKSFSFKFKFYTFEFPNFICSTYNDFFTVLMDPPPADVNQTNKNITFDAMKNPISVNNAFLDVCNPQMAGGKNFTCVSGPKELVSTGFDDVHAATSWLVTQANVTPGSSIWLEFAAFDSGDGVLDSTGLADDFEWSAMAGMGTMTHKPLGALRACVRRRGATDTAPFTLPSAPLLRATCRRSRRLPTCRLRRSCTCGR